MSGPVERVRAAHERATDLRAQADAAAHERDALIAQTLDRKAASGPELAASLGLSTQRLYDMANRARRRASLSGAPRKRG